VRYREIRWLCRSGRDIGGGGRVRHYVNVLDCLVLDGAVEKGET